MKIISIVMLLTGLIIIGTFSAGCSMTGPSREDSSQIKVLVTVLPEAGYAKSVGGERVEVFVAVPPGADPHTFEPSVKDMEKFADADMYFTIGKGTLPFEDNLVARLSSMNPRMKVVDISSGINLLLSDEDHHEGDHEEKQVSLDGAGGHSQKSPDPHIWVSLKNTRVIINHMYDALAGADPAYAPYYQANRDAFMENITLMDNKITHMLEKTPQKKFIASHASWGYFARDYGLTQVVIGKPGKEATSKDIETLLRMARDEEITMMVTEPQYSHKAADMIANSINGSVVIADPLAPEMPSELYKLAVALSGNDLN